MLPANFRIAQVDESSDQVLRNLFELYLHDLAEWFKFDTTKQGNFDFPTREEVWERGIDVHFLYAEEIPIGFALVGAAEKFDEESGGRDMVEFFVVRRHRRSGIGRAFAAYLWSEYPGRWLVRVFQQNMPAIPFWRSSVATFTSGDYDEEIAEVDGRQWSYFRFNSAIG